jgi:hypothetical protein
MLPITEHDALLNWIRAANNDAGTNFVIFPGTFPELEKLDTAEYRVSVILHDCSGRIEGYFIGMNRANEPEYSDLTAFERFDLFFESFTKDSAGPLQHSRFFFDVHGTELVEMCISYFCLRHRMK